MAPVADALLVDVRDLAAKVRTTTFQPAELANGATELLNEVSKSKLTGEEERYSRTDLSDVAANLEGSQAAFTLLAPGLTISDRDLTRTLESRFATVRLLLQQYWRDNGNYLSYTSLTTSQLKALTVAFDALAEPLSTVGERVVALS
jgi:iron uptake system component EfeO